MTKFYRRLRGAEGFSLMDAVATMAVVATISAVAVPQSVAVVDSMRLGMSLRDVERELQFARLKAVSTNRPMRVRFDCPVAGQMRVVELIGAPAVPDGNDAESNLMRCDETAYPYSPTGGDKSRLTRPNNDGPIRRLQQGTTFVTGFKQTLEFWPDGSVHAASGGANPWPVVGSSGATISLTRRNKTKSIKVNNLGKILLDR